MDCAQLIHWLPLFGICLLGAMSPGPSLAVVVGTTLGRGRRAGYGAALGHGLGVGLYGLLTVSGLAVLMTRSPALFLALQLAGAGYLLWLGRNALRSGGGPAFPGASDRPGQGPLDGFLVAFLNPKLAVFMLALFSQFVEPGSGMAWKGVMIATVGVTDAAWYSLVVRLVSAGGLLGKLEANAGAIDRLFGVILIALAVTVSARALLAV